MDSARDQFIADVAVKLDRMSRRLDEIEELAKKVEPAANNLDALWRVVSQAQIDAAELRQASRGLFVAHDDIRKRLEQIAGHRVRILWSKNWNG